MIDVDGRIRREEGFDWRGYLLQNALMLVTIFLLLLVLLGVWGLRPREEVVGYEYDVVSPEDVQFVEEMNGYGMQGWRVVSCRRALDSLDKGMYECVLIREREVDEE